MAVVATPTVKFAKFTVLSRKGIVPWISIKLSHPKSRKSRILAPTLSWKSMSGICVMGLLTQQAATVMGILPLPMKQHAAASNICIGMGSMEQKRPMDKPTEMLRIQGLQRSRTNNLRTILFNQLTLRIRGCLSVR